MLLGTPYDLQTPLCPFLFLRDLLIYLSNANLTGGNLNIKHCLIDQAAARLKSGSC